MRYEMDVVILCCASILLGLQGCVYVHKVDPLPEFHGGSPLSGVPSVTVGMRVFGDARQVKEFEVFVNWGQKFEPRPVQIVEQAIEKELVRNGHKVIRGGDVAKADVILDGSVTEFRVAKGGSVKVVFDAVVEVRVATTLARAPNEASIKRYTGRGRGESYGTTGVAVDAMREAVVNMIKELTNDPEFLDRIRNAKGAR